MEETIKTTRTTPVEVSKQEFTNDVNSGMTYPQLTKKYNLAIGNIKAIAKQLGVQEKVKRAMTPKYIIVDNNINTNNA